MKLHFPYQLRNALMACACSVAVVGTTLTTGALVGGALVAAFAGQAMAEGETADFAESATITDLTYADYATINVTGGTLEVTHASVWGEETAGKGFTTGDVNVTNGATLLLSGADALGYAYNEATDYTKSVNITGVDADTLSAMQLAAKLTLESALNLNGNAQVSAASDAGYIEANGGTITVTNDNNTISASVTTSKSLTVTGTGSLTMGTVTNNAGLVIEADTSIATYSGSGSVKVADGTTMTITGQSGFVDGSLSLLGLLGGVASEEGYSTGTVVLEQSAVNGGAMSATTTEVKGNFVFHAGLSINSYDNSTSGIDHTVKVLSGASLTAQNASGTRQDMEFLSNQRLHIAGGAVTAGGLKIGHSSTGPYSGELLLESGSLSVDYISLQNVNDNEGAGSLFQMTGGTLSILSNPWQGGGSLRIADEDTEVQLLGGVINTTGNSDGAWLNVLANTKITLGAVEFAGDKNITLSNGVAYFAGTVTNNVSATLQLTSSTYIVEDASKLDSVALEGPAATENGYGTATYWLVKAGDNAGTLVTGTTTATVNGTERGITVANGAATFTAAGTKGTYYVNVGEVNHADVATNTTAYVLGGGQLNVATGTAVTQGITVNAASTVYGEATSGTNHAGLTGGITGTANLTINSAAGTASNNSSHGNFFALSGDINLGSANLIIGSGVVRLGSANQDISTDASSFTAGNIVVSSGATLEVCRNGGTINSGVTLEGGTLRIQQVAASGSGNLTFGTLTVNAASVLDRNSWGYSANFSALSGAGDLTVSNSGSTTIGKLDAYTGNLQVNGGTVNLTDGTISSGKVTVGGGTLATSKLALTGGELVYSSGSISVSSGDADRFSLTGGTLTAAANVVLSGNLTLGAVTLASNTYDVDGTATPYTITLGANGTTNFVGTVVNQGALTLSGTLTADLSTLTHSTANTTENGFLGSTYTLVQGSTGATLTVAEGATVNGKYTVTVGENGGATFTDAADSTVYHVNVGEVTYDAAATNESGSTVTSYDLKGGQLNVSGTASLPLAVSGDVTIATTADGAQLKGSITANGEGGDLTISATGTAHLLSDVRLGDNDLIISSGTVRLGNFDSPADKDHTVVAGSIVVQEGATMDFHRDGGTLEANIELAGGMLHTTVIGDSGTGTLEMGGLTVSADSKIGGLYGGGMSFTSVTGTGSLSIAHSDMSNGWRRAFAVVMNDADYDGKLSVGDLANVNVNGGELRGNVAVSGSGVLALHNVTASGTSFDINAALQVSGSTSIAESTALHVGSAGSLVSTDGGSGLVVNSANNTIEMAAAADGLTQVVASNNASLTYTVVTSSQLAGIDFANSTGTFTINLTGTELTTLLGNHQDILLVFVNPYGISTSDGEEGDFTNGNLNFALNYYDEATGTYTDLADHRITTMASSDLASLASGAGFTLSDGMTAVYIKSVPEPTTATLSLLALAGLAARRRRK